MAGNYDCRESVIIHICCLMLTNCSLMYLRYYVNRDALFSYHPGAECFLAQLVSIYVSAHYKNTPGIIQIFFNWKHELFKTNDKKLNFCCCTFVCSFSKPYLDDLQMLSDAPAHHLFVLMAPIQQDEIKVPQVRKVHKLCKRCEMSDAD